MRRFKGNLRFPLVEGYYLCSLRPWAQIITFNLLKDMDHIQGQTFFLFLWYGGKFSTIQVPCEGESALEGFDSFFFLSFFAVSLEDVASSFSVAVVESSLVCFLFLGVRGGFPLSCNKVKCKQVGYIIRKIKQVKE